jgi:uncharacterized protein (TIGR03083 family)
LKTSELWHLIHAEREQMADTLAGLSQAQWDTASWCAGWTTRQTAGHILAAAEQTPINFYKQMIRAGFRFNVFAGRDARRLGALPPEEIITRLRARTTTTNRPPAPLIAMLGEIVVHGADIRRPLGMDHRPTDAALTAVAENYRRTNLLIGSKRRIAGLRLEATDQDWSAGNGPKVTGPLLSLILAMSGRRQACDDLDGDGLEALAQR